MVGRLAVPPGEGVVPAVLVAHEANGLDDFQKSRPERFAELGYAAFALDYHGGGRPLTDRAAINARLDELTADVERTRAVAAAGLAVLLAQPRADPSRVAAVGYCFGGTLVLELARSGADLKAVIGLHPGLSTTRPDESANIRGTVLMCIGSEDPIIPVEQRLAFEAEMRAAGVDWQMHLYGGAKHSFTHPRAEEVGSPALQYDEQTDRRSWRDVVALLEEVFGDTADGRAGSSS
jgi:dienelactone hydrolase